MNIPNSSTIRFTLNRHARCAACRYSLLVAVFLSVAGANFPVGVVSAADDNGMSSELVLQKTRVDEFLLTEKKLSIFTEALQSSRYWSDVKAASEVTVFVPTNEAMQDEGSAFLLELVLRKPENSERLDDVTGNHIVASTIELDRHATQSVSIKTVNGICVSVAVLDNAVRIGPEAVLKQGVEVDNGRIYLIDRLLWAPYDDTRADEGCG